MVVNKCLVCGDRVVTYPSRIKVGRGKYCSKKCSDSITLIKKAQRLSPATEIKPKQRLRQYKGWKLQFSRKDGRAYKLLYLPSWPSTPRKGYIREHRYIMELHLGRALRKDEVVHHINGDTIDNRIENLQVMNKKDHDKMNVNLNIHRRWIERGDAR